MGPSIHRQRESDDITHPYGFIRSADRDAFIISLVIVLCLYSGLFHRLLTAFGNKRKKSLPSMNHTAPITRMHLS